MQSRTPLRRLLLTFEDPLHMNHAGRRRRCTAEDRPGVRSLQPAAGPDGPAVSRHRAAQRLPARAGGGAGGAGGGAVSQAGGGRRGAEGADAAAGDPEQQCGAGAGTGRREGRDSAKAGRAGQSDAGTRPGAAPG